jgi:hypothetical protein
VKDPPSRKATPKVSRAGGATGEGGRSELGDGSEERGDTRYEIRDTGYEMRDRSGEMGDTGYGMRDTRCEMGGKVGISGRRSRPNASGGAMYFLLGDQCRLNSEVIREDAAGSE